MGRVLVATADQIHRRLLRRFRAGDREAGDRLYAMVQPLIATKAWLIVRKAYDITEGATNVDVNDMIQEGAAAFLDSCRCFKFGKRIKFLSYLGDNAYRRMNDAITGKRIKRNGQRYYPPVPDSLAFIEEDDDGALADRHVEVDQEPKRLLDRLMDTIRLPRGNRMVIRAFHGIDGNRRTFREIADELGVEQGLVRRVYNYSRKRLKERAARMQLAATS